MIVLLLFIGSLGLFSCNQASSNWKAEEVSKSTIDWTGSWPNGREKLKVLAHEWKAYEEGEKGFWAFRVHITYPENVLDDAIMALGNKSGEKWAASPLVIPVNTLTYSLYDEDGFLINSAIVDSKSVEYMDSSTIQFKKEIDKMDLKKATRGKVKIQAGYFVKKSGFPTAAIRIQQKYDPETGVPVIDPKTGESIFEEIDSAVNKSKEYPSGKYPTTVYLNIGRRDPNTGRVLKDKIPSWDETEEIIPSKK